MDSIIYTTTAYEDRPASMEIFTNGTVVTFLPGNRYQRDELRTVGLFKKILPQQEYAKIVSLTSDSQFHSAPSQEMLSPGDSYQAITLQHKGKQQAVKKYGGEVQPTPFIQGVLTELDTIFRSIVTTTKPAVGLTVSLENIDLSQKGFIQFFVAINNKGTETFSVTAPGTDTMFLQPQVSMTGKNLALTPEQIIHVSPSPQNGRITLHEGEVIRVTYKAELAENLLYTNIQCDFFAVLETKDYPSLPLYFFVEQKIASPK